MSPTQTPRRASAPVTRRSARQERIARRHPERDLGRASTKGKRDRPSPIVIGTVIAVVAGIALIGFAILSNPQINKNVSPIQQPGYVTPSEIAQHAQALGTGTLTVTEYADFQCPWCGTVARTVLPQIIDNYVKTNKITLVHHDLVVVDPSGQGESHDAANAARCAADQGKFWQFHDWLYGNQASSENVGAYTQDRLLEVGRQMGLDMSKFQPCVDGRAHMADVNAASSDWPASFGNKSTPTIVVNGQRVSDPTKYDTIARAIDDALAASPAPSTNPSPSASASASVAPTSSALVFGLPLLRRLRRRVA